MVMSSSEKRLVEEEIEAEEEVKWANHYSSDHYILLVGEGDFSFSLSLANAFGSASNIVATSLDSHDTVLKNYGKANENLENLKKLGATVFHEIDATKMKFHTVLKMQKFDRIIFNFPHVGFIGKEDDMRVIYHHRELVKGFFANASHMLRPCGEVHVSHKIGDPFHMWKLEELASTYSLMLTGCVNFDIKDYPGYNNKRGADPRCDEPFPLGECRSFKFEIGDTRKRALRPGFDCRRSFPRTMVSNPCHPHEGIPNIPQCSSRIGISSVNPLSSGFQAYVNEMPRNTVFGYSNNLEEILRRLSRREWLLYLITTHGKEKEAFPFGQNGCFFGE